MPLLLLHLIVALSLFLHQSNGDVSSETGAPRNLNAVSYKLGFYSDGSCSVLLQSLHVHSDFCQKGRLVCIGPYRLVDNVGGAQRNVSVTYHLATSDWESAFELDYYSNLECMGAPASHYNTRSTHESNMLFTMQCARSYRYPTFEEVYLRWEQLPPDCAAYHGPIMSTTTTTTTTYPKQALPGDCGYEDSFSNPFVMIAGRFGSHGNSGDDNPALSAQLNYPIDIELDPGEAPAPPPTYQDKGKFPPYGAVVLPPGAPETPLGRQVMSRGTVILPPAPEVMPVGLQERPDGAVVLPPGAQAHPEPRVVMDPDWIRPPGPEVVTYGAVVMPPGPPGVSYGSVVLPPGTRVTPPGAEVISFGAVVRPPGVAEMPKFAQVLPQAAAVQPPGGPQGKDHRHRQVGHSVLPGAQPLPLAEVVPVGVPVVLPRPYDFRVKPPGWRKVYVSDSANHAVRLVDLTNGTISTIAGRLARPGASGSSEEQRASSALLRRPHGLALDVSGRRLYVADYGNHIVRCIDLAKDTIRLVAGIPEVFGHSGDGGAATAAQLFFPAGLALADRGKILYVADSGNHAIRRVDLPSGLISTVAGTLGAYGTTGDGGLATSATLNTPRSISLDEVASKLYISDHGNHAVRILDLASGEIGTLAGVLGMIGGPGDGAAEGPAIHARLCYPTGLTLDQVGAKLYIADACNLALRRLDLTNGVLVTVAARAGFLGHLRDAGPVGLAFDPVSRQVYTAEARNHVVRATDMDAQVEHHNRECRPIVVKS